MEQARARLEELTSDAGPVMRRFVRVIGDRTCCPGFQFQTDGALHPVVTSLFRRAMELKIPHNHFAAWMITASTDLDGGRPVDLLHDPDGLRSALMTFARR